MTDRVVSDRVGTFLATWRPTTSGRIAVILNIKGEPKWSPISCSHRPISDFWKRFDSKTSASVSVYQESREKTDPISRQQLKQQWEEECGKKGRKEEENRAGSRVPPSVQMTTLQGDEQKRFCSRTEDGRRFCCRSDVCFNAKYDMI